MNVNDTIGERSTQRGVFGCVAVLFILVPVGVAQESAPANAGVQNRIRALTEAMNRVEAQVQESQRELAELKQQIAKLRVSVGDPPASEQIDPKGVAELAAAVESMRETQSMQGTQIATLEQTKVETASKYPLKVSGMILMTGFVNTRRVDVAATPTVALGGAGSTGATTRQTVLGLDASGPHIFGAQSHGDLRFDMYGSLSESPYGLLRLRTAHAELNWDRTKAFFALDRPMLNPNTPTSLTAVAEPALAWSGNLWAWNSQAGATRDLLVTPKGAYRVEGALIDIADPPAVYPVSGSGTYTPPGTGELSRWPGAEARIAYEDTNEVSGAAFGLSGIFAPHRVSNSFQFDSWAAAVDFKLPFLRATQLSGNGYWGAALGGLGGGAHKDYVTRTMNGEVYHRALDDSGGWVQWKQKYGERLEFNEAFGIDNVPTHQLRPYADAAPAGYFNLTRNRTFTGNVIYSPTASLLFSLEYRRIASSYVTSPTQFSDVIGAAAGYKF